MLSLRAGFFSLAECNSTFLARYRGGYPVPSSSPSGTPRTRSPLVCTFFLRKRARFQKPGLTIVRDDRSGISLSSETFVQCVPFTFSLPFNTKALSQTHAHPEKRKAGRPGVVALPAAMLAFAGGGEFESWIENYKRDGEERRRDGKVVVVRTSTVRRSFRPHGPHPAGYVEECGRSRQELLHPSCLYHVR